MKIKAIDIFGATALAALAGVAIAGAVKRKREQDKIKSIISGIGATGYASKKRIQEYFKYPDLIDRVYIDLTWRKGEYVRATIYFKYRMPADFWISKEDARWLSALCDQYDVDFDAWNGNVYLPTLHKKIVMDFETETERLPRI